MFWIVLNGNARPFFIITPQIVGSNVSLTNKNLGWSWFWTTTFVYVIVDFLMPVVINISKCARAKERTVSSRCKANWYLQCFKWFGFTQEYFFLHHKVMSWRYTITFTKRAWFIAICNKCPEMCTLFSLSSVVCVQKCALDGHATSSDIITHYS